jgi:hypothetical protein
MLIKKASEEAFFMDVNLLLNVLINNKVKYLFVKIIFSIISQVDRFYN